MRAVFVTTNEDKRREAQRSSASSSRAVWILDLPEIQALDFAEVAVDKALAAREALGSDLPVLVEDSGLVVGAWNGLPGALTKWFLAASATRASSGCSPARTAPRAPSARWRSRSLGGRACLRGERSGGDRARAERGGRVRVGPYLRPEGARRPTPRWVMPSTRTPTGRGPSAQAREAVGRRKRKSRPAHRHLGGTGSRIHVRAWRG